MILPSITLQGLATTSLLVSLLIALFLPLRPLLRRVIGSQWLCMLWLALLIRLLMPWPLESRWSMFNRWQHQASPAAATATVKIKVSFPKDESQKPAHTNIAPQPLPVITHPVPSLPWGLWNLASIAWLAGLALSMGMLAWRWLETRRIAAKTRPATDDRLLNIFHSIPPELRRGTQLRMTDLLHVPTLAGIFRPQIWMPVAWPAQFTDDELRNVLLHELGHARRRDLLVQWIFAIAQCIHWFNPLVWLASRAARLDREMACDAWVLSRNHADQSAYGGALMKTVQLLRSPLYISRIAPATVAMASNRRNLYERISGIGAFRPMPAWRGLVAIAIMAAALAAATTSRTSGQDTPAAPPATAAPKTDRKQVRVQTHFVMITEDAWKKLCADNPAFKNFAGKFPELDQKKASTDDLIKNLNNLKEGAWQIPHEMQSLTSFSDNEKNNIFAALKDVKGVSFLTGPTVTTWTGQRALVEMAREFRHPTEFKPNPEVPGDIMPAEFITHNAGITLEAFPAMNANGTVDVQLTGTMQGCLGMLQEKDGVRKFTTMAEKGSFLRPVFSVSTGSVSVNIPPTRSVLLGGVTLDNISTDGDAPPATDIIGKWSGMNVFADKAHSYETVRHVLLIFVTTSIEPPAPVASPSPAASSSTPQIEIETKFIGISEEAFKKVFPLNPDLRPTYEPYPPGEVLNLRSAGQQHYGSYVELFPELDTAPPSYADFVQQMNGAKNTATTPNQQRLIGVFNPNLFAAVNKIFSKTEGYDPLSAPTVTIKDGQEGRIALTRPFKYPSGYGPDKKSPSGISPTGFDTRDLGESLLLKPSVGKSGANGETTIDLQITDEFSELLWYSYPDANNVQKIALPGQAGNLPVSSPIFGTHKINTTVSIREGSTILLGLVHTEIESGKNGEAPHTVRKIHLTAITASLAGDKNADEKEEDVPALSTPTPASTSSAATPNADIPYGTPVEGKPGFAMSPYAPGAGVVDLRGYAKGAQVRDPYTGKTFLVP